MRPKYLIQSLARLILLAVLAFLPTGFANDGGFFQGSISGISNVNGFDDVQVILSSHGVLQTASPDSRGQFAFFGIADGDYTVKVRKPGFKSTPAHPFRVERGAVIWATNSEPEFVLQELDQDTFVFHWEEDQSTSGFEYKSNISKPRKVQFLSENITVFDSSVADKLHHNYNISLLDGSASWTAEHAYRLLQIMEKIPQQNRNPYDRKNLPESHWFIDQNYLPNDIQIVEINEENGVRSIEDQNFRICIRKFKPKNCVH